MAKYDKKAALKIIVEAAREYEEKLNDKHFLIRAVLSVGFKTGMKTDFPVTLYNEDVRKLTQPTNKILAVFSKHYGDLCYDKCTYLSKGQELCKILLLREVKGLIQMEIDNRYHKDENS